MRTACLGAVLALSLTAPASADPASHPPFAGDLDLEFLEVLTATPCAGRFVPMVQDGGTRLLPSPHFVAMAPALADFNKLVYQLAKGRPKEAQAIQAGLPGWQVHSITGRTGGMFFFQAKAEPGAALVAHDPATHTVVVAIAGSCHGGDWDLNLAADAVRMDQWRRSDGTLLGMVGRAHKGFLAKFDSVDGAIRAQVDAILAGCSSETRPLLKFYVTGHSQGAAVGQLVTVSLCQHLRRTFGSEFNNRRENRVGAWLLASPRTLDATGAAFINGLVGRENLLVQNTRLDIVPNLGKATQLNARPGVLVLQDSEEAKTRASAILQKGAQPTPWFWEACHASLLIQHMVVPGKGFHAGMVHLDDAALGQALDAAVDQHEERLRAECRWSGYRKLVSKRLGLTWAWSAFASSGF